MAGKDFIYGSSMCVFPDCNTLANFGGHVSFFVRIWRPI